VAPFRRLDAGGGDNCPALVLSVRDGSWAPETCMSLHSPGSRFRAELPRASHSAGGRERAGVWACLNRIFSDLDRGRLTSEATAHCPTSLLELVRAVDEQGVGVSLLPILAGLSLSPEPLPLKPPSLFTHPTHTHTVQLRHIRACTSRAARQRQGT